MDDTRTPVIYTDDSGSTIGWAIPHPDQKNNWIAVHACTQQEWDSDVEAHDEAPDLWTAEELTRTGFTLDGGFCVGTAEEVREALTGI